MQWSGLEELKAWLRDLPEHLTDEASSIINAAANESARRIVDLYPTTVTGNLKDGVEVKTMKSAPGGRFGIGVVVRSTAKIALIYENGTQVRHTGLGYNRGSMPAQHVLVKVVTERRRRMYEELKALMVENGLKVSGTP
jgi:hypothetical protein